MKNNMRVGHGYDFHAFELGSPLVLAGVKIEHSHGLRAHSDGDALIHAICDSILGSLALGDIGEFFSDTDSNWQNIDSRVFLKYVLGLMHEKSYTIVNIDATVITELPKITPHKLQMQKNLAKIMQIDESQINIKATRHEGCGTIGRKEGLAVLATILLQGT